MINDRDSCLSGISPYGEILDGQLSWGKLMINVEDSCAGSGMTSNICYTWTHNDLECNRHVL